MVIFHSYVSLPEGILYYGYDMTSHCLVYYTMVMMGKKWILMINIRYYPIIWCILSHYNDNIHHIMRIDHYNGINYNDGYYDYQWWIHNYDSF